ncbi:MAG: DNA recombination protein RmuC, partial [Gemmatimonadetes bacterium]|nr:DNA recombination protein RmuC [Gemmatimonadota bacterium]
IEKRASEVWEVLGAVKTEFGKFGGVLDKVKKQLRTASRTIDDAGVRTRAMERRLRSVEQLPESDTREVLGLASGEDEELDLTEDQGSEVEAEAVEEVEGEAVEEVEVEE